MQRLKKISSQNPGFYDFNELRKITNEEIVRTFSNNSHDSLKTESFEEQVKVVQNIDTHVTNFLNLLQQNENEKYFIYTFEDHEMYEYEKVYRILYKYFTTTDNEQRLITPENLVILFLVDLSIHDVVKRFYAQARKTRKTKHKSM